VAIGCEGPASTRCPDRVFGKSVYVILVKPATQTFLCACRLLLLLQVIVFAAQVTIFGAQVMYFWCACYRFCEGYHFWCAGAQTMQFLNDFDWPNFNKVLEWCMCTIGSQIQLSCPKVEKATAPIFMTVLKLNLR